MSRILWIDDDFPRIRGLMRPLEREGHQIEPVGDMASALEKLVGGFAYDLVVVDILLPYYKSVQGSLNAKLVTCIEAGKRPGVCLIQDMRENQGLRCPIVVMSVMALDGQVRAELEPFQISAWLAKGDLTPDAVYQTLIKALDDYDFEGAAILNLQDSRPEVRRVGLEAVARMSKTPQLYQAVVQLLGAEADTENRELAASILKTYASGQESSEAAAPVEPKPSAPLGPSAKEPQKPEGGKTPDGLAPPKEPGKADAGTTQPAHPGSRVLWLLVGILGIAGIAVLVSRAAPSWGPVHILVLLFLAIVTILGTLNVLLPGQVTKLLGGFLEVLPGLFSANRRKSESDGGEQPSSDTELDSDKAKDE